MLVLRYFLCVGGALLGLLYLADWYFPLVPSQASAGDVDRSIIRIHSSRQWPEPVRIDTTRPMPEAAPPALVAQSAANSPIPDVRASASSPVSKAPDTAPRRTRLVSRLPKHKVHRRIASSQPNWLPDW
jgi:hypothetical protein